MEVKFTNPFAKKRQSLKEAAATTCDGCGDTLPDMTHLKIIEGRPVLVGEDTIRRWCSKPKKAKCRKLYRAKTRVRTATRHV